jgi:hypothetical protein
MYMRWQMFAIIDIDADSIEKVNRWHRIGFDKGT